ncbi:MAG: hypothetical protein QW286_03020 [Candidatus Aenigmatarchaeota archaeon]
MHAQVSRIIRDIKKVKIQSAHGIARAGIECLKTAIMSSRAKTRKEFLDELQDVAKKLKAARPTEIELASTINLVLFKISENETEDLERLREFSLSVCEQQIRETEQAMSRLIENGAEQIENGDRILTHCHSRTVVGIFREAKKQGKDFTVYVTETRPLKQGLITAKELLSYVRKVVSEYALSRILKTPELGGIDEETRFYLLWRWTYNSAKVHFDDARKLAQAVGIEITEHWGNGFIKKEKEFISVLDAKGRGNRFLEKAKFENMIDVLHASLIYWEKNKRKDISALLEETANLNNTAFWQVAQAISDVLPEGDKEKQMLQGFLYGRESYKKVETDIERQPSLKFGKE